MDILTQEHVPNQTGTLAMALIIASQTPVVLLDGSLDVIAASASFYRSFGLAPAAAGRINLADLGEGEWNVPQLIQLLRATATVIPPIETYGMELVRPNQPTRHLVTIAITLDYDDETGPGKNRRDKTRSDKNT